MQTLCLIQTHSDSFRLIKVVKNKIRSSILSDPVRKQDRSGSVQSQPTQNSSSHHLYIREISNHSSNKEKEKSMCRLAGSWKLKIGTFEQYF